MLYLTQVEDTAINNSLMPPPSPQYSKNNKN